jgi:farnesyl-diphosphate farnesyltransferase
MSEMTPLYQMLRDVSRTFALSIEQLPRGPRDALTLGYLLLRVSDGIEDYPALAASRKAELLRAWERVLSGALPAGHIIEAAQGLDPENPEVQVALQSDVLLRHTHAQPEAVRAALLHYVRETTLGMARWQEQGPILRTEAELDDYMHQVAGLVGYLITEVFAVFSPAVRARRERLMPLAREFGLGLQTVNIIRGFRTDFERGWVFVPREYYEPLGLSTAELFDPRNQKQAIDVLGRLAAKADRHLWYGMQYVTLLPRRCHRLRLMCVWPLLFAARTLAVSRDNLAALESEAKIGRNEVRKIMRDSALFGWSNRWLRSYYDKLDPRSSTPARTTVLPAPELLPAYAPAERSRLGEVTDTRSAPGSSAGGASAGTSDADAQSTRFLQRPTTSRR